MPTAPELDVRPLPPPRRHPEIFRTFDALSEDGSFVLVNDHDPKPLLYQFQAERAGRFDWSVLEAGPERFRVEIRRRAAGGPRTVSDFLEGDHRRLDGILPEVDEAVRVEEFERAGGRFAEFRCGLERHIEMEERILFPAFEAATGMVSGPTVVMRMEHREIKEQMEEAAAALAARDGNAFRTAAATLRGVLGPHNMKEEQILYPLSDRAAGDARGRDDLVRRMQAL